MATEKQVEMRQSSLIDQPKNDQSTTEADFIINMEETKPRPKMGKVPEILRQNKDHEDSFRPLLMAFGPYHHHGKDGEKEVQQLNYKRGEELKIRLMRMLQEEEQQIDYKRGKELKIQLMRKFYERESTASYCQRRDYDKVVAITTEARKMYSEDSTKDMNDVDFAKMMLLDGCAILQFISCAVNEDWSGMNIKNHEIKLIMRDLFLLENQLPSIVLKELIKDNPPSHPKKEELIKDNPPSHPKKEELIKDNPPPHPKKEELIKDNPPSHPKKEELIKDNPPSHPKKEELIEDTENDIKKLFEKFINKTRQAPEASKSILPNLANFCYKRHKENGRKGDQQTSIQLRPGDREYANQKREEEEEEGPLHLLDSLWKYYVQAADGEENADNTMGWYTFRSVKELKAAGILSQRSKTTKFTDVRYVPLPYHKLPISYLHLPPIVVDDSTKSMLLNLASYEMSSDRPVTNAVSSYICFMDSLIDHKEDVAELRRKRIILNRLGSDEMVAGLFNDVAKHLVPDPKYFGPVMREIDEHYRNQFKTRINELFHDHFSRPWTVVIFLVAVAGLVMTFIQTYTTVYNGLINKLNY